MFVSIADAIMNTKVNNIFIIIKEWTSIGSAYSVVDICFAAIQCFRVFYRCCMKIIMHNCSIEIQNMTSAISKILQEGRKTFIFLSEAIFKPSKKKIVYNHSRNISKLQ